MEKKLKWPKFLTIKRTVIFAVLILFIAFILIYFLGGYQANAINKDMKEFNEEGFVSYQEMIENLLPVVKQENQQFKDNLVSVTAENYRDTLNQLSKTLQPEDDKPTKQQVNDFISHVEINLGIKLTDTQKNNMLSKAISDEARAEQLLDVYELLFENEKYQFYFNSRYTTFKIVSKADGTEWYSNPNNTWKDPTTGKDPASKTSAQTLIFNQQSPLIVNFLTRGGDVKPFSVYEYSISDTLGSGTILESIDPTYQVKINKENNTVQVYYELLKKGASYTDYPKSLTLQRIDDLIARNQEYIAQEVAKFEEYRANGDLTSLQEYVTEHREHTYIVNYAWPDKHSFIGVAAYNIIYGKDAATETDYITKIGSLYTDVDKLCDLAIEMLRVEYEYNYKNGDFNSKDNTNLELQYSGREIVDSEEVDEKGKKLPDKEKSYLTVSPYEEMNRNTINILNQILYTKLQYTMEDLQEDLEKFEVEFTDTNIHCFVAIEYELTKDGLKATVLNNSIKESQPEIYPLYRIDILPYFSSENFEYTYKDTYYDEEKDKEVSKNTKYNTVGGIIIPDGSGAYIELNNGKTQYPQYSKRVYSTDLAFGDEVKKNDTEDVLLPMYGLISNRINSNYDASIVHKNSSAVIARVVNGAAQCTLSANISQVRDSYNRAYYTTTYRESQLVTIGSGWSESEITRFTADYVLTDTTIDYHLYSSATQDYTYSDLAKYYQQILVDEGTLVKYDDTNETVLNTELLGVYDYTTNFLGIVYSGHKTLTTYEEAQTILESLKLWGATNVNVLYRGWRDGGLVNETFKDMSFANKLGSKKEYNAFIDYIQENNYTLYPVTNFLEINKYNDTFGKNRYSTRDISNEYTKKYPYDLAGNMYDTSKRAYYTLSPKFFNEFAEILAENFNKKNPELSAMAFEKLGSNIVGDYKKRSVYYREDSVNATISALDIMKKDNRITDISLNAPYEFSLKYSNNITNLPYESTLYEVFDYTIPFYQLIVSGYIDYSGLVINANDEIALNRHLMNIFQTGSNVHFTFSYKDSSELIQTDYNYYYYTQYSNWENEVKTILSEIAKYNLHEYALNSHKVYVDELGKELNKVYEVTYQHKTNASDSFEIYLNFSDETVTITDRNANIQTLSAWSYYVDKEVK